MFCGQMKRRIFLLIISCLSILAFIPNVHRGSRHRGESYFDDSSSSSVPFSHGSSANVQQKVFSLVRLAAIPGDLPAFSARNKSVSVKGGEKQPAASLHSSSSPSLLVRQLQSSESAEIFATTLYTLAIKKVVLSSQEKAIVSSETRKRCEGLYSLHHSAATLWAIGTLKFPTKNSDVSLICDLLLEKVNTCRAALTASDLSLLLVGLARLGVNWRPANQGKTFLTTLGHLTSYMDEQQLSNSIWAMGKIGVSWDGVDAKARRALIEAIKKNAPRMSPQGVANTIHGLSFVRAKWGSLPAALLEALVKSIAGSVKLMSEQEVSNCLSGLGRLGASWEVLPDATRRLLGSRCAAVSAEPSFGPRGLSMSLHGLGRMEARWARLPGPLRNSLLAALDRIAPSLNAQEISNALYGLGKMGVAWKELPAPVKKKLLEAFAKEAWRMNGQGVANSCWGFMLMGVDWSTDLSGAVRSAAWDGVRREAASLDEQEVGTVIYAFSKMDVAHSSMPLDVRSLLLQSLTVQLPAMAPQGVVMVLLGLARQNIQWASMPDALKTPFLEAATRVLSRVTSVETVNSMVFGLSAVGLKWSALAVHCPKLQAAIAESLAKFYHADAQELAPPPLVTPVKEAHFPQFTFVSGVTRVNTAASSPRVADSLLHSLRDNGFGSLESVSASSVSLSSLLENVKIEDVERVEGSATSAGGGVRLLVNLTDVKVYSRSARSNPAHLAQEKIKSIGASDLYRDHGGRVAPASFMKRQRRDTSPVGSGVKRLGEVSINKKGKAAKREVPPAGSVKPTPSKDASPAASTSSSCLQPAPSAGSNSSPNLIYSLGGLGCPWDELGAPLTAAISRSLVLALEAEEVSEQTVVNAFHGLSSMAAKWCDIPQDLQAALLLRLMTAADKLGEQGVAVAILSLAKLEVCWERDLSEKMQEVLRRSIFRQSRLGEHALASLLYGLAKLGRKWDDLHPLVRSTLKEAIVVCHIGDKCTAQGVANSVYGLARMDAKWAGLSSSVRMALLSEVSAVAGTSTETQLSNIVWSLGKLDVKWADLPAKTTSALCTSVLRRLRSMNEQHISSIVFSLGAMGASWEQLPPGLADGLLSSILRVGRPLPASSCMSRESAAKTSTWGSLAQPTPDAAVDLLDSSPREMAAQGLSMILLGLAKMGVTWTALPDAVLEWQRESIRRLADEMNGRQVSSTVLALGRLGWSWGAIGERQRRALLRAARRSVGEMSCGDISNVVHGLGVMGATWVSFPPSIHDALALGVMKVGRQGTPTELASSLYGVALMECQWTALPAQVRADVVGGIVRAAKKAKDADHQAVANMMYSLSLLVFDMVDPALQAELTHAHVALLDAIAIVGVGRFSEKEREQILMYVNLLSTTTPLTEKAAHAKPIFCVSRSNDHGQGHSSRLQETVVASLAVALQSRNTDLQIEDEYSAFNGAFPIDATVLEGGTPIGFIEIDGPHHYRNGSLRRKDKMKEMLYRKKHPTASFTRVSYDQVRKLGTGRVAFAVANFLTLTAGHRDDLDGAWSTRNAERELNKILSVSSAEETFRALNTQSVYSIFGDVTWSTGHLTGQFTEDV